MASQVCPSVPRSSIFLLFLCMESVSRSVLCLVLTLFAWLPLRADAPATKRVEVMRAGPALPDVDGKLDDPVWREVRFVEDFLQKDPVEGGAPSVRTQIGFAYDEEALYVAAVMWIDDPDLVRGVVTRRDNSGATDRIIVSLDTYRDRRTAYSFSITAAGVRTDYYHGSDQEYDRDYSFNPVWKGRTWVGTDRWTAEMRIPFSQLRFNDAEEQLWGLNVNRYLPKRNEDLYWVVVPKNGTGWSSQMGTLRGIRGIRPSARLELLPYAAMNAVIPGRVDPADPYTDKVNLSNRLGLDAKVGLGPNLTLDATINPDFGQVEADPAEVNLSAYETFFNEQRPFFVEGAGLFDYSGATHFYSRRIGAAPHRFPSDNFDYLDQPQNTTILGAAKLTGRMPNGFSIGGLLALGEREFARATTAGVAEEREYEVEPLTLYGVGRVQQEFGSDASTVGLIGTVVRREMEPDNPNALLLPQVAITGGTDGTIRFDGGAYFLTGNVALSHVEGKPEAIARVQRSSVHYFQRPDADHVEYDPARTSLTGYAASLEFGNTTGDWTYSVGSALVSPEYELNDIGQLQRADDISTWGNIRYRDNRPGPTIRYWDLLMTGASAWNFGGTMQRVSADLENTITWANYLSNYIGIGGVKRGLSDAVTRGGPLMDDVDLLFNGWVGMYNSYTTSLRWSWHFGFGFYEYEGGFVNTRGELEADVSDRLELSLRPNYYTELIPRQYVETVPGGGEGTFGSRYVFSALAFSRTALQFRLNYAFTPDLSLEVYAEPFIANGEYRDFGELKKAGTGELEPYEGRIDYDAENGLYLIDDGADSFTLPDPDFHVRSFRSNVVLRWEWLPGSTFFLVWQQDRSGFEPKGEPVTPARWLDPFSDPGDNFLAIKISYWLPVELE